MFTIETIYHNPSEYPSAADASPRTTYWRATGGTCDEYIAEVTDADQGRLDELIDELTASVRRKYGSAHHPRAWELLA